MEHKQENHFNMHTRWTLFIVSIVGILFLTSASSYFEHQTSLAKDLLELFLEVISIALLFFLLRMKARYAIKQENFILILLSILDWIVYGSCVAYLVYYYFTN